VNALGKVAQALGSDVLLFATIVAPNANSPDAILAINLADKGNTIIFVSSNDLALALALLGSQTVDQWRSEFGNDVVFDPGQSNHSLNSYYQATYTNDAFNNQLAVLCAAGNKAACDH
jgi:hypothetical protein